MTQELTNPFGRVFLTIKTDTRNRLIYVNWMGYLTEENIKAGVQAYTDALARAKFHCVLNDTRLIIGSWDHSIDWILNEWAPLAAKRGLKRLAMLANPDTFGGSSAATFLSHLGAFEGRDFDDMEKARAWLKSYTPEDLP